MKHFRYKIEDDLVVQNLGEVDIIPAGFIECPDTFGVDKIYYKIEGSDITEIIGEGFHESTAKRRVDDFLSRLSAHLL